MVGWARSGRPGACRLSGVDDFVPLDNDVGTVDIEPQRGDLATAHGDDGHVIEVMNLRRGARLPVWPSRPATSKGTQAATARASGRSMVTKRLHLDLHAGRDR